ncbi:hypothetical protein HanIR_Chr04g0177781 [Helianthus annuus]|nr:hypothetical protein HanIR_Chr04g0177781 [Helianthus annuus]
MIGQLSLCEPNHLVRSNIKAQHIRPNLLCVQHNLVRLTTGCAIQCKPGPKHATQNYTAQTIKRIINLCDPINLVRLQVACATGT